MQKTTLVLQPTTMILFLVQILVLSLRLKARFLCGETFCWKNKPEFLINEIIFLF